MIESETIETVYSNLVREAVYSEEIPDFRLYDGIRITEESEVRKTEDNETRIIQ